MVEGVFARVVMLQEEKEKEEAENKIERAAGQDARRWGEGGLLFGIVAIFRVGSNKKTHQKQTIKHQKRTKACYILSSKRRVAPVQLWRAGEITGRTTHERGRIHGDGLNREAKGGGNQRYGKTGRESHCMRGREGWAFQLRHSESVILSELIEKATKHEDAGKWTAGPISNVSGGC